MTEFDTAPALALDRIDERDLRIRADFLAWVVDHFSRVEVLEKRIAWCPRWWEHPEALARIYALWEASVQAGRDAVDGRLDARSNWWSHHWDHHAPILFDPSRGPFRDCDEERHTAYKHRLTLIEVPLDDLLLP